MKKNRQRTPRTRQATKQLSIPLSKLPKRSYAARDRALHVLAIMRANPALSLGQAAKREGVKPHTVRKYFGSALRKVDGRIQVRKSDRFARVFHLPNAEGRMVPVNTRSSKDRTALGQYLSDIGRFLRPGGADALVRWRGKIVAGVELVTDERTILQMEPLLEDFSLYRAFNGATA